MNPNKRKRIDALITLVDGIRAEEMQDLKDTPDSIENSGIIRQKFNHSIGYLTEAIKCLLEAK